MANAADVLALVDRRSEVRLWALVPNERGAEMALAANIDALTVTVSACPVYNERNVRRSIDESVEAIGRIVEIADGRVVDVVISCVFGSPYTGDEPTGTVPDLMSQLAERGVNRFTLADTTGMATPHRIERVLHKTGVDVGLHLHDTRGTALVNAFTAIGYGVTRFDTAVGGLGGSPFARGAGGNLATEDLVHLADDDPMLETGVDLAALLAVAKDLERGRRSSAARSHRHPRTGRVGRPAPTELGPLRAACLLRCTGSPRRHFGGDHRWHGDARGPRVGPLQRSPRPRPTPRALPGRPAAGHPGVPPPDRAVRRGVAGLSRRSGDQRPAARRKRVVAPVQSEPRSGCNPIRSRSFSRTDRRAPTGRPRSP